MLQKKLLARLGLLVAGFITGAVVSIVLLQGVLRDLNIINSDSASLTESIQDVSDHIDSVAGALENPDTGRLPASRAALVQGIAALGRHAIIRDPAGSPHESFAQLETLSSGELGATGVADLRHRLNDLARVTRARVVAQQVALSQRLRLLIIGLTVAAIAMLNITIFVLLRTANMILRPVGELVEASRQLAQERFDCRVNVRQNDEFAELARSYNTLADHLASNEKRKIEALGQLAVTLNHEVNNAINAIDLQLSLLDRRSGGDPALGKQLRGIHENLAGIARTIASLRNVRRIVLTDYSPGLKMIDLPRSVAEDAAVPDVLVESKAGATP